MRFLTAIWALLTLLALALAISGCTTVIPQQPESPGASFDNGVRNSGLICITNLDYSYNLTSDLRYPIVGIITSNALARYNDLIKTYGNRFHPPLNEGEGTCTTCVSNLILIQAQDLEHFIRMNRWRMSEAK